MLMLMTLLGCGDKDGDTADSASSETWNEVIGTSCAFSSCHGGGAGDLTLSETDAAVNHAALVDAPSVDKDGAVLVVPGDVSGSYLMDKLNDADGIEGTLMPPGQPLDASRIAVIEAWIEAGAPAD